MEGEPIDEFLKQVDAKFAGKTPNGQEDPRRLTVGFSHWSTLRLVSHRPIFNLEIQIITYIHSHKNAPLIFLSGIFSYISFYKNKVKNHMKM